MDDRPPPQKTPYGTITNETLTDIYDGKNMSPNTPITNINTGEDINYNNLELSAVDSKQYVYTRPSTDTSKEPVTFEEAKTIKFKKDKAEETYALEQKKLENIYYRKSIEYNNNPESIKNDPAIIAQDEKVNESKTNLQTINQTITNASDAPDGKVNLLKAGLTDKDIDNAQQQKSTNGNGDITVYTDLGNLANTANSENIGKRQTGFENVNNSAPFYFQMPTLKSITDFRMKNGYSPYGSKGSGEIARDAVHFSMFDLNPPAPRANINSNNIITNEVRDQGTNLLGTFTIYPNNQDWLSLSHTHKWGNDMLSSIVNTANTALGLVDNLQSLISLAGNITEGATLNQEQAASQRISRKIDMIDTYQSSEKLTVNIPFILFTKDNFLEDVYKPLLLLTAMTYPKRLISGDLFSDIEKLLTQADDAAKNLNEENIFKSALTTATGATREFVKNNKNAANDFERNAGKLGGYGLFRYNVSKRPEYMTMRHASGLIYFPLAYIDSIKYTFKGPWYNYNGQPFSNASTTGQIEKVLLNGLDNINATSGGGVFDRFGRNIKNTFTQLGQNFQNAGLAVRNEGQLAARNIVGNKIPQPQVGPIGTSFHSTPTNPNIIPGDPDYKMMVAYPSQAEVSITVRNAAPLFRDDFMQLFFGASNEQDLVNVTVQQTGQGNLITPSGETIRRPVGMNAGDLPRPTKGISTQKNTAVNAKTATKSSIGQ